MDADAARRRGVTSATTVHPAGQAPCGGRCGSIHPRRGVDWRFFDAVEGRDAALARDAPQHQSELLGYSRV
jgi:hypothetical protein